MADPRNKAPVFPDQDLRTDGRQTDQKRTVPEDLASPWIIGAVITASDPGDILTYSLGGADAASFSIDSGTAQLTAKGQLDYETKNTYTVTVTAADPLNARSTITVAIKVTNVDEMPELEGVASVKYPENGTGQVATFTAVDPEGESILWSLAGADMEDFSIENGVLRFKSPPDFEMRAGTAGTDNNTYVVMVQASDGGAAATAMEEVTIEVTNVDEPGTVTLSTLQPQLGVAIMATLADPDGVTAAHHLLAVVPWHSRHYNKRDRRRRHDHVLLHSRGRRWWQRIAG